MKKGYFLVVFFFLALSIAAQVNLKSGLVAHYALDGHAVDSGPNGLNGVLAGTSIGVSRFSRPTAMNFNGNGDAMTVAGNQFLNLTSDKSISVWYKLLTSSGLTYYPSIIYHEGTGFCPTFAIYLREDPGYGSTKERVSFIIGQGSNTNKENFTTQNYKNYINQWIHIVATYSNTDGYMKIFFNGVISDSLYVGNFSSNSSSDSMRIGKGNSSGYTANYFKGSIDDIRLYNRALTKQEVDSLYNEHLLVFNRITTTICQGDSLLAGGSYRKSAGEYFDTIPLGNKIDSIVVTTLKINSSYLVPQTITICGGGRVFLGGKMRTLAGIYYDSLYTSLGCDSIIATTLVVYPSYYIPKTVQICSGQSVFLAGANQSIPGVYFDSLYTTMGCDSIIATTLIVSPGYTIQRNLSICQGDSLLLQGQYRKVSGMYYDSLNSAGNCDSITITQLTVNPSYSHTTTAVICGGDSIWLQKQYRKTSGVYYDTLYTRAGCDSVRITTLTVNPSYFVPLSIAICQGDSIFIAGSYRYNTGTYLENLQTVKGCDSIVQTTLKVNPSYFIPLVITICQGDSAFVAGAYRKSAGVFTQSLQTTAGCDSIIQTTLKVNSSYTLNNSISICGGDSVFVSGGYVKSPGVYYDYLSTAKGCDSTIVTTLTVNNVNTLVTQNSFVLLAQESAATYRWLDCNNAYAVIAGQTQQSFIATVNGDYAVEITKGNCTDTSGCYTVTGLGATDVFGPVINIYPNPAKEKVTVDLGKVYNEVSIAVYTIAGKLIHTYPASESKEINIETEGFAPGMYLLEVTADGKKSVAKILVE